MEEKRSFDNKKCDKDKVMMKANVNNTTVEGFTKREVERARACRKLMHDLGAPSYADLKKFVQTSMCRTLRERIGR